jgi:hypothetical protein
MSTESQKNLIPGCQEVPFKLKQRLESLGAESVDFQNDVFFGSERERPDFLLNFILRNRSLSYYVEWKTHATPQIVRDWILVNSLPQKIREGSRWMFCSSFISEESAKILEDNQIDFLDFSGNVLLTQDSLYLKIRENKKNPFSESKLISAFRRSSTVSSRIFRTMLKDASRFWKYEELQLSTGCSQGQIRKVKLFLQETGFLEEGKNGFRISNLSAFLKAWGKEYQKQKDTVIHGFSFDSVPTIERKASEAHAEGFSNFVLTSFSAAARWKLTAKYQKAELLVSPDQAENLMDRLKLKKVESGGNVDLILAYDSVVFQDSVILNESPNASLVQCCLDLSERGGRSEEARDALIKMLEESHDRDRTGIEKRL